MLYLFEFPSIWVPCFFNFHLDRIAMINDLNESSDWDVRMNSWNKAAHCSVWNCELMSVKG